MAKSLDFKLQKSVDVINEDIKSATNGKIDKILGEIESNTAMILANALYFKGLWKKQFKKERTQMDVFTTYDNKSLAVQMMYHNSKYPFGYSRQLNARAVELSYENSDTLMVVVLPEVNNSLKQIGDKLTIKSLNQLVSSMHTIEVELYLPKFKVESSLELIPPLQHIGIKSVFDAKSADFSGLSHTPDLYISQVIQKAVIEVSEEGTEAAAATEATLEVLSMPITETFKANRPFLYLSVTKNESKQINSIIFMGECHNPNQ
ncbi:unnamed protein product [Oppiella nova]|uniref:Serpin domain-containing protein n=1 Tax=Oppiella nova TaxID=334625 RepID=A0A7R9MK03_9ACAR|nr:unnamed protein product [Oppiella nova]CAG2178567.1 unnamed protein product [Oppiella nova]